MSNITVDDRQVLNLFSELSSKRQKEVHKTALKTASNILIKQTRTNLRSIIKSKITAKSNKTGKSLSSGVKYNIDKDATQSTVHIMGDFRLKFFELGTKIRKTRKGYNRGKNIAKYFFKIAKSVTESQIFSSMEQIIKESIIRVNNKYK